MNERIQQLWQQLAGFFLALPPARRATVLGVGATSMALVLGLAWWVQRPLMRPLFTNLAEQDAGAIVEVLRAEKVPFTLEAGGRAILVPAERLYELRLALAGRGLPEGGGVGFEIFDKQTLGQTDFVQRLNYQRALQGELGRTIGQLGGVEAARVHLALPERSLFVGTERRPSASVVVRLTAGRTLSRAQIDGIVHLVAASVEGMVAEAVTVVDESGRILTPDRRDEDATAASSTALDYQRAVERATEERVESMLGAVVGRDKVIARVTASFDFSRVERTEETYDPDRTALRSRRSTREETVGNPPPGGAPGVQANLTNDAASAATASPRSERRDDNQSFEVSKVVSRTVAPVGVLTRLSVAVLIDGTYAEGEGGARVFTPRPAEEVERLKGLVQNAIGFNAERGDAIEIASVPFQAEPVPEGEGFLGAVGRWLPAVATRVGAVGFVVAMLLWVVRPVVLGVAGRRASGPARIDAELDAAMGALTHQNLSIAQEHPERAARLVREWLLESAGGAGTART